MDVKGPQQESHPASLVDPVDHSKHLHADAEATGLKSAAKLLNANKHVEFLDLVRDLRKSLDEKTSECGLLKMKLSESDERVEMLGRELDECKLTMFQNNEDSKKLHEEVIRSKKLEEDYVKLMSSYLNLEERYEQHRQNLYNNYLAKTNAINNYESIMSREVLKHELEECRVELHEKILGLSLVSAKLRNLEEDNTTKEGCIGELRKSLDDAKVAHKHETTVLEEYIKCFKNTITSYEKTLASYHDARQHAQSTPQTDESIPPDGEKDEVATGIMILTTTNKNRA